MATKYLTTVYVGERKCNAYSEAELEEPLLQVWQLSPDTSGGGQIILSRPLKHLIARNPFSAAFPAAWHHIESYSNVFLTKWSIKKPCYTKTTAWIAWSDVLESSFV